MPQYGWNSEISLKDWLFAEGYRFDFFQAVRLLEQMHPECASAGYGSMPDEEAVQFQSNVDFGFPASDIQDIVCEIGFSIDADALKRALAPFPAGKARRVAGEPEHVNIRAHKDEIEFEGRGMAAAIPGHVESAGEARIPSSLFESLFRSSEAPAEGRLSIKIREGQVESGTMAINNPGISVLVPAKMVVNFMGLAGAHGPLPQPDTELILERARQRDTGLRDFLDIFNHRLISLMYRVAKVHRVALTSGSPELSPISGFVYSLLGLGLSSLRNRMEVNDRALLYYSGLICQEPRSAVGLERALADYFQVGVCLKQFQGHWRNLEPDQWTSIGFSGQNQLLGQGAAMGKRYWDQQGHFEVALGPVSFTQFLDFLPNGSAFRPLCALTRFYAGQEYDFSFNIKVLASEVPESRLGRTRLGWTTWLRTQPVQHDDSQVHLSGDFSPTCETI